jgi:drug/metabolite transporter (DMT)-like permease
MLTPAEKRFIRQWEDQRTGGKWKYLAFYTFCWTFIFLVSPILLGIFFSLFSFLDLYNWPFLAVVLLIAAGAFALSHYIWEKNEKRLGELKKIDNR